MCFNNRVGESDAVQFQKRYERGMNAAGPLTFGALSHHASKLSVLRLSCCEEVPPHVKPCVGAPVGSPSL